MDAANSLINKLVDYIVNPAILVVFTLGFFLFLWGLVMFLWHIDEGGENAVGKRHMVWGIVGMLIMVSVYGIINIIDSTFQLNFGTPDTSALNNINAPANFFGQ